MSKLEHRIPPPIVALLLAAVMWLLSLVVPRVEAPPWLRVALALAIAVPGAAFSIAGAVAFRRAKTTLNPLRPEAASTLVTGRVYRITRNPMYVGLLLGLVAWAVGLSSLEALVGPVAFMLYINRFQIGPEEKALSAKFGGDYAAYTAKVRRWLGTRAGPKAKALADEAKPRRRSARRARPTTSRSASRRRRSLSGSSCSRSASRRSR